MDPRPSEFIRNARVHRQSSQGQQSFVVSFERFDGFTWYQASREIDWVTLEALRQAGIPALTDSARESSESSQASALTTGTGGR